MTWVLPWYDHRGWLCINYQELKSGRQSIKQSSPWRCRLPVPTPAAQRRRRSLCPQLPRTCPAGRGPSTQNGYTHYPRQTDSLETRLHCTVVSVLYPDQNYYSYHCYFYYCCCCCYYYCHYYYCCYCLINKNCSFTRTVWYFPFFPLTRTATS